MKNNKTNIINKIISKWQEVLNSPMSTKDLQNFTNECRTVEISVEEVCLKIKELYIKNNTYLYKA